MKCSVRTVDDRQMIDIDGRILQPYAYMTYAPLENNLRDFLSVGGKIVMFPLYAGDEGINMECGMRPIGPAFFLGYGKYDFSEAERLLNMICPNGNEDVFVIFRVCVEPPRWWQDLHPDEVARDFRGEPLRECVTSALWREDMSVALKALIDFIDGSRFRDRVIGYHIAGGGTEEWAYQCRYDEQIYDCSEVNRRAYADFLRKEYPSLSALNAAHGKNYADFSDVPFPSPVSRLYVKRGFVRDPERDAAVLDYYRFHNESVAETVAYFCRRIKEFTGGKRLTGAFYGYVLSMPQNKKGLHALRLLLDCPWIDFLSTTNQGNGKDGSTAFSSAVASAKLHGKLWMMEGDVRTSLSTNLSVHLPHALPDNDYYTTDVWKGPATVEESCDCMKKNLARLLTTPCGIWWFDMFGDWFAAPEYLSLIGSTERGLSDYRPGLRAEVAVFVDETGHRYNALPERNVRSAFWEFTRELSFSGVPYDVYLLSDVTSENFPAERYKLCYFLAATNPSEAEKTAIREKLQKDGKTLVWLHTSGMYAPELTGFPVGMPEKNEFVPSVFEGVRFPSESLPQLRFGDVDGYVLASDERGEPSVIFRESDGYNSVYSLPLAPCASLMRRLYLLGGVHMFNRDGDCVYAGGNYVALYARKDGFRRICLPERGYSASDLFTGKPQTVNDCFIDMKMKAGGVRILRLEK